MDFRRLEELTAYELIARREALFDTFNERRYMSSRDKNIVQQKEFMRITNRVCDELLQVLEEMHKRSSGDNAKEMLSLLKEEDDEKDEQEVKNKIREAFAAQTEAVRRGYAIVSFSEVNAPCPSLDEIVFKPGKLAGVNPTDEDMEDYE